MFIFTIAVENFKLKNSIIGNTKYNKIKFLSLPNIKIFRTQLSRKNNVCNEMILIK